MRRNDGRVPGDQSAPGAGLVSEFTQHAKGARKAERMRCKGIVACFRYRLASVFLGDAPRAQLVRGALGSGGLKAANTLVRFALAVFLARTLGPEGYGIYAFALSLIMLLAIPAHMGLPTLVVREVAKYQLRGCWSLMRGLLGRANQAALLVSVVLTAVAVSTAWLAFGQSETGKLETFFWAVVLVPLTALGNLSGAVLRGLRRVVQGQLSEMCLRPGLHLLLIGAAALVGTLTPQNAMALHVLAAGVAFLMGIVLLVRALPADVRVTAPSYDTAAWVRSLLPLSFLAGAQVINTQTDIVMLGVFTTSQDVGIYRVAVQGAQLAVFSLAAINMTIAPYVSRLHASGDGVRLQRMATWSARIVFIVAVPVVSVFILFGGPILAFVFGSDYRDGHLALAILCAGQLVNAGMGSVGLLLNMTGHEWITAKGFAIAAIANIGLNVLLIPLWGMNGAATATAVTLATWNALLCWQVWRKLGVASTPIRLPAARISL